MTKAVGGIRVERFLNSVVYGQTIPCPSNCVVVVRQWHCHESSMGLLCSCVCLNNVNVLVFLFHLADLAEACGEGKQ